MNILGLLASCAAAVSLLVGASRHEGATARGYRWLAGAAVFWFAGLLADQLFAGSFGGSGPLSLADVAPLLAMGPFIFGVTALASEPPDGGWRDGIEPVTAESADSRSILSALADGYVMAIALLVIGWVTLFGADYRHSGEGAGTFLQGLVHPLVDAAVLGMLLPALTTSWRRVGLPYLALLAIGVGDALGVASRLSSGHPSTAQQVAQVVAFVLLGLTPWISRAYVPEMRRLPRSIPGSGRIVGSGRATVVSALTVAAATLVVLVREIMGTPDSALAVAVTSRPAGLAVILAGGAALLVLVARVLVLIWETSLVLRAWRESSGSLRELADRTSDVVLVTDLDGAISYASPAVTDFGYTPDDMVGMRLDELVHPEDLSMALRATRAALGQPSSADAGPEEAPAGPDGPDGTLEAAATSAGRGGRAAPGSAGGGPGGRGGSAGRHRARRDGPVPGPGADRRRNLAAHRVHDHAVPGPGGAGPVAGHRAGHQRPGGAAPAGHPPDLPRRPDRPAQPGLPGGAVPRRAAPPRWRHRSRRGLPRPGRLHRGQRLGRPRRGRPGAGSGRPAAARDRAVARHRGPLGWRRVRGADRQRSRRPGHRGHRRADGRDDQFCAVPGRRPGHRDDRECRRRAGRRLTAWAGAAQRRRGHVEGQGQRRRPGRGVRGPHARRRGPAAGAGQRPAGGHLPAGADRSVPAGRRPGDEQGDRGRGPGSLVAGRRRGAASRLPGRGRGFRPDRPAGRLGAGHRVRAGRGLAVRGLGRQHLGQPVGPGRSTRPGSPSRWPRRWPRATCHRRP